MTSWVRRVAGHGGAAGAASMLGLGPHGAVVTVLSVLYLVGYLGYLTGRALLGALRWAKLFVQELLEFLSLVAKVPPAWRESQANWKRPGRQGKAGGPPPVTT